LVVKKRKQRKAEKPIEKTFMMIARRAHIAPQVLRGKDRRWEFTKKRAEAVALLVRAYRYRVSEVAEYLGRDQAHIRTMLSRVAARERHWD
jgi:hypothetical protein